MNNRFNIEEGHEVGSKVNSQKVTVILEIFQ